MYITGKSIYTVGRTIREQREKHDMTQRELADELSVSDKTVSKWETEKGLPDISVLPEIAKALGISVAELFTGEVTENKNRSANMKKCKFYVCPVCGNVICSVGEGTYFCCGIMLPVLEVEKPDELDVAHEMQVECIDDQLCVTLEHPMEKNHYISFIALVTTDTVQIKKMYPEQPAQARFSRSGHGDIYVCCNKHGLHKRSV